jgi:hypothetical protein
VLGVMGPGTREQVPAPAAKATAEESSGDDDADDGEAVPDARRALRDAVHGVVAGAADGGDGQGGNPKSHGLRRGESRSLALASGNLVNAGGEGDTVGKCICCSVLYLLSECICYI